MSSRAIAIASLILSVLVTAPAHAQVGNALLRPEWSVEPTRAGRARVVGYVYNTSLNDAGSVWLRVERLTPDGQVGAVYRGRVLGDVLSGGRFAFDVPVPEASSTYRVLVESVDWFKECR
jgi:hypothetical protein